VQERNRRQRTALETIDDTLKRPRDRERVAAPVLAKNVGQIRKGVQVNARREARALAAHQHRAHAGRPLR
jgi:hypothetical protein